MSTVSQDLLKNIQVDNLMSIQLNENTLKNNFDTIIQILSALKSEVGSFNTKILNVENTCSQLNVQVNGVKEDIEQIKDNEKDMIRNLQNLSEKTQNNTTDISEIQKKLQNHDDTLLQHQYDIDMLKDKLKNVDFNELKDIVKAFPAVQKDVDRFNQMSKEFSDDIQKIKETLESMNSKQDYLQMIINNLNEKQNENNNKNNSKSSLGKKDSLSDRNEGSNSNKNGNSNSNFNDANQNSGLTNDMAEKILQDLEKMKSQFVTKEELKKDQDKQNKDLWDELNKLIQKLQKQIDDRVKCDDFDQLSLFLQSKLNEGKPVNQEDLNQLGLGGGGLSTKDKNLLNTLQEKIDDLEGFLNALREELHNHIDNYNINKQTTDDRLDELEKNMLQTAKQDDLKRLKAEVKSVREGLDKNVDKTNQLEILINELKKQLTKLRNQFGNGGEDGISNLNSPSNGINGYGDNNKKEGLSRKSSKNNNTASAGQNLNNNDNINNNGNQNINIGLIGNGENGQGNNNNNIDWGQAIEDVRSELIMMINQLKDLLDRKADKDDLYGLEQMLLGKLDEVAGAVLAKLKQSASGPETAKKFLELEKKITNIYNIFFNKDEGDDGLIVKRPLNQWSCISCDKSLNKYKGKLGNYHNWAIFPPKETSPEKMGRYGQSYYKNQERKFINTSTSKKAYSNTKLPSDTKLPTIPNSHRDDQLEAKGMFYKTSGQSNPNLFTPKIDGNNSYNN